MLINMKITAVLFFHIFLLVFYDVILSATERELTRKLTKLAPKLINGL